MLAVIIPYFKLTFLEKTLESLVNQTDKRFKVYIGDDASPEDPSILIEKFQGKIDIKYNRFKENLGGKSLTKQWERCVALAGEEQWIMILGDDDMLGENTVESFYKYQDEVVRLGIDVIRFATMVIDQNGKNISIIHMHPKLEKSIDFLMRKIKGGTRSSLSEFVFRKKTLKSTGFRDLPLAWNSDVLAFLEVSRFNLLYTINEAIVCFRLSNLNITSKGDNLTQKNIATFEFYYYLLNEKKEFLDCEQTDILLSRLEKTFLDNKKNIFFWMKFTKLYVSNFYFKKYMLFIYRMIQSI